VPLTLACRSPNILAGCLSVILVADSSSPSALGSETIVETLTPSAPPLSVEDDDNIEDAVLPSELNFGAAPPPLEPSTDPEFDNVLSGAFFSLFFCI
jgi:hypothetical protein